MSLYTNERNAQILISLLKSHGVKKIVASPGTTNACFVASVQNDSFFEVYSAPEERSGAYMACGLCAESGEPVVLSCTGATASRNYMPALTEAYYRKLPVLAVTSSRRNAYIGHNYDQVTDRTQLPNDVANLSVQMPIVHDDVSEWECVVSANKAILELTHRGGGPVHINLETTYSQSSVSEIPYVRCIRRVSYQDVLPEIPDKRVAIFIGAHLQMSSQLSKAIDVFCEKYNAIALCDHTSNYKGKYRAFCNIVTSQMYWRSCIRDIDLLIHIGDISSSDYGLSVQEVWRVNPDGQIRDTFRKLSYVFEMDEEIFFRSYNKKEYSSTQGSLLVTYKKEEEEILHKIPELPFSNIWVASVTADKLPDNSVLHLGIRNSLRSWNFFDTKCSVLGYSNTGGFGIDGSLSTTIGAALANPNKVYYCILGDLAFFYDMNALGNRHIPSNVRIMVVNNGLGFEMKFPTSWGCSIANAMKVSEDNYICAAGHYSNHSLVESYVRGLGFEYISASDKEGYMEHLGTWLADEAQTKPIVFEIFVSPEDEDVALNSIMSIMVDGTNLAKATIKKIIGKKAINTIKKAVKG